MIKGMNNKSVRRFNAKQIMRLLFQHRQLSKSKLAEILGLSIPAITKILNYLVERDLVDHVLCEHTGRGNSTGLYQMTSSSTPILCLHVTPYKISAIVLNGMMDPIMDYMSVDIQPKSPEELISLIFKVYGQCSRLTKCSSLRVAMAVHGQVDRKTGSSVLMPQAIWDEPIDFRFVLGQEFGAEVQIDNDCVMLALAEKWLTKDHPKDFCVINVDYGIGSSFLIDDKIFRGELFGSGQIGHSIIDQDGKKCSCGRYGCLETVSSSKAITASVRKEQKTRGSYGLDPPSKLEFEDVVELYLSEHSSTTQIVNTAANAFGISLYNFLVTLSVNDIVIYGGVKQLGEGWLNIVKIRVLSNPFETNTNTLKEQRTSVRFGELSESRLVEGIGFLYIESFIDSF